MYFPETGHHLRAGFLAHWRAAQGLERLGFPTTEEAWEPAFDAMVQRFTRGRLEWRPPTGAGTGAQEVLGPSGDVEPARTAPLEREPAVPDWTTALVPSVGLPATSAEVRQGRTLVIEAEVDDPAAPLTLWGTLGRADMAADGAGAAQPLRFFPAQLPAGTRFRAFAGIPSGARLESLSVLVGVRNALQLESASQPATVRVVDGGFPLQRLAFAADLLPLLEPEVGVQEVLTIGAVTAESAPGPLWRGRFQLPVDGRLVTAHGARRDYLDPAGQLVSHSQHSGVDLAASGGTPIRAAAAGVVAFTGRWSIRGNVVVLDHGAGVHSLYAHASQHIVAPGQAVTQGQPIALVGSTGLSTGPHLHWELRAGGVAVEPLEWTQRADLARA